MMDQKYPSENNPNNLDIIYVAILLVNTKFDAG